VVASKINAFKEYVDSELEKFTVPNSPKELYEPISYILSLGGKRMRPILVLMANEMFGGSKENAINQALAVEVFHNFTLMHDDIMDKAPYRRGNETVHKKWNENIGILSGDVMFVLAYKLMCDCKLEKLPQVLEVFSKTAVEVCEGQQLDMNYETENAVSINDYIEMIRLKTAVLLGGSLKIGSILADANAEDAENLYLYGQNIGIAFQLHDDLLDVFGDPDKFGKQVGGDIISNKKTFLFLKAFENANAHQNTKLNSYFYQNHLSDTEKVNQVKNIYNELNIQELTKNEMNKYYDLAMHHLDKINVSAERKQIFIDLANNLMHRES
jgi:geranylgeranyl diphosphate synthase, type II